MPPFNPISVSLDCLQSGAACSDQPYRSNALKFIFQQHGL